MACCVNLHLSCVVISLTFGLNLNSTIQPFFWGKSCTTGQWTLTSQRDPQYVSGPQHQSRIRQRALPRRTFWMTSKVHLLGSQWWGQNKVPSAWPQHVGQPHRNHHNASFHPFASTSSLSAAYTHLKESMGRSHVVGLKGQYWLNTIDLMSTFLLVVCVSVFLFCFHRFLSLPTTLELLQWAAVSSFVIS